MVNEKNAFIAIVGRPNVGKSSVLNKMLGEKVAIVSPKPQTTRTKIMGVLTKNEVQLVFIDTPGLLKPKNALDNYMVRAINNSVAGVDACLLVVEAGKDVSKADSELIGKFKQLNIPAVLAINKIDLFKDKSVLMEQITKYNSIFKFASIVPVSAKHGENIDTLISELSLLAQDGQHFFDSDTLTDQPERVIVGEIIREKILRLTDKEIPHGTAVVIERMKQRENAPVLYVDATIYCEKSTHKGILIGKSGSMLKKIGTYAREDMERFFDVKVNLTLWVKVKEDWRSRESTLQTFGYDLNDFNV